MRGHGQQWWITVLGGEQSWAARKRRDNNSVNDAHNRPPDRRHRNSDGILVFMRVSVNQRVLLGRLLRWRIRKRAVIVSTTGYCECDRSGVHLRRAESRVWCPYQRKLGVLGLQYVWCFGMRVLWCVANSPRGDCGPGQHWFRCLWRLPYMQRVDKRKSDVLGIRRLWPARVRKRK
jgi:hypothetical protein